MAENNGNECAVRFEVVDNGIGITDEMLERLGEIFEQADDGITREHDGMGLGLSLTKRIVDLMGGELWAESKPGEGSRFICGVRLGIVQTDPRQYEKGNAGGVPPDLTGKRVMIVDDVDINREILLLLLDNTGAVIDEANTGDEAVRMFLQDKYDLILMDIRMPVMDGFTATKKIRASAQPWAMTVPVISVSAEKYDDLRLKCLEAGINDHITKPVEMEALFEMIAKWTSETPPFDAAS